MGGARVCLGVVVGAHGVHGLVRVRSFTEDPEDIAAYGLLEDEQRQRRFEIELVGRAKGTLLARVQGIGDREQAQALAGTQLYVDRAALPAIEEEEAFYHADLIGLAAEDPEGRPLGQVSAVHNFGAGDVLEVQASGATDDRPGPSIHVPFTRAAVPLIDLSGGRLVVDPPPQVGKPEPTTRAQ